LAGRSAAPVVLAGGPRVADQSALIDRVRQFVAAGAAGVAFGRNIWGSEDPVAVVHQLREVLDAA
jgi:DhnA family fructose-bisphosphate aldolase class Ia